MLPFTLAVIGLLVVVLLINSMFKVKGQGVVYWTLYSSFSRRWHLFEIEDQSFFPAVLRDLITDMLALNWGLDLFPGFEIFPSPAKMVAPTLLNVLTSTENKKIIDMCSGGGGPIEWLAKEMPLGVTFTLTDLYPNLQAFEALNKISKGRIHYSKAPVDATKCELKGVRSMFASFHHMPPPLAAAILKNSVENNEPIVIFEITKHSIACVLFFLVVIPFSGFTAPLLMWMKNKPVSLSRVVFTYVIPIFPFLFLWDGVVSALRTYSEGEFLDLVQRADPNGTFHWEVKEQFIVPHLWPLISYIGVPKAQKTKVGERKERKKRRGMKGKSKSKE